MTHTYACSYDMIWHDLTEDPHDLPTESYGTYILTRNTETRELDVFFAYDPERYGAEYDPTMCLWTTHQDTYWGDGYEVIAFRSFGLEPITSAPRQYDKLSKLEVVAWAEEVVKTAPPKFVPAIFRND